MDIDASPSSVLQAGHLTAALVVTLFPIRTLARQVRVVRTFLRRYRRGGAVFDFVLLPAAVYAAGSPVGSANSHSAHGARLEVGDRMLPRIASKATFALAYGSSRLLSELDRRGVAGGGAGLMKRASTEKRSSRRLDEVRSVFEANYLQYQYQFVEFFVEHLSDISRAFRGDLQSMILLALVGQVQMQAMRTAAAAGEDPHALPPERLGITASRLADVTGIPRQTVRRKLEGLERTGWIVRNDEAAWRIAYENGQAVARTDLEELDRRAMDRVARLFCDLEKLVSH